MLCSEFGVRTNALLLLFDISKSRRDKEYPVLTKISFGGVFCVKCL
jgi:hypothetical protein